MKKLLAFILTVGIFAAIVFVPPVVGRELLRREIIDIRDDVPKPIDAWLAGLLASVAIGVSVFAIAAAFHLVFTSVLGWLKRR